MSNDKPLPPEAEVPKPKAPTEQQIKDMLKQVPKATGFFGIHIDRFSKNDMLRIITWVSVSANQQVEALEQRIKLLEGEDEVQAQPKAKKSTKPAKK